MKPKEIQEKLGIDASRIKLFKCEGIFSPENPPTGNRGTNYTEKDYENLRVRVVLTKSGLTCSDIRKLQDGDWTLEEAIIARRNNITADIERKSSSLALLSELLNDKVKFETFETDRYWNIIAKKEASGEKFIDVEDIYDYNSVSLIHNIKCPYCTKENKVDLEEYLYNESSSEKENGMGPDIVYDFDSEYIYRCPTCDKIIQIKGWIREYPMGTYDSESICISEWEE